jgi:hypothetical protein
MIHNGNKELKTSALKRITLGITELTHHAGRMDN